MEKIEGADKKIPAGIFGILLGGLGIHKFYLGYQKEGIILLGAFIGGIILSIISCGVLFFVPMIPGIIGLIEGIIYLAKSDEEFVNTYVTGRKPWF